MKQCGKNDEMEIRGKNGDGDGDGCGDRRKIEKRQREGGDERMLEDD